MTNAKGRLAASLLTSLLIVLAFPAAASADVVGSAVLDVTGNDVRVDAPGHYAFLTAINNNTAAQAGDSNTITELKAALGCGTTRVNEDLCPLPDVGVITTDPVVAGSPVTACAGRS